MSMITLYITAFCHIVIGLVFLFSSVSKAVRLAQFKQTITDFHVLPSKLSSLTAFLLLLGEFSVVILMAIGGDLLLPGFILASTLLIIFCSALVSVLLRRLHTSCNCFGINNKPVTVSDLWRNLGFVSCALGGCIVQTWLPSTREILGGLEWILISSTALIFVMIWIQLGEITQLFTGTK